MGRRFYVKPPRLRSAAVEIHGYSRKVDQISYEILDVARGLKGMSGMEGVCSALKHMAEEAGREAYMLDGLSDAVGRISVVYDKAENNISVNGEKSRQRFPVHGMAAWSSDSARRIPFGIKILR